MFRCAHTVKTCIFREALVSRERGRILPMCGTEKSTSRHKPPF
jgi:hypothetical protein